MVVEEGSTKQVNNVLGKESGQSLAEYGLILLLVICIAVVALTLFGNRLLALFTQIINAF